MSSGYVCWGKSHPQMLLFLELYRKNEAVEWNYQKKHQFLGSHRSGEKYKQSLQILLLPPMLSKVQKFFLNWKKQDYLIEGAMVGNWCSSRHLSGSKDSFGLLEGPWRKLNITFTVGLNHKQKAPVEIHSTWSGKNYLPAKERFYVV